MNEASVYLLKQNNGTKEIFSNNFFLSTFESYHPLHENDPEALFTCLVYRLHWNTWLGCQEILANFPHQFLLITAANYYQIITEGSATFEKFTGTTEKEYMHFQLQAEGNAHVCLNHRSSHHDHHMYLKPFEL